VDDAGGVVGAVIGSGEVFAKVAELFE